MGVDLNLGYLQDEDYTQFTNRFVGQEVDRTKSVTDYKGGVINYGPDGEPVSYQQPDGTIVPAGEVTGNPLAMDVNISDNPAGVISKLPGGPDSGGGRSDWEPNYSELIQQYQTGQMDEAQTYKDLIDKGAGYLDPYRQAGAEGLGQMQAGMESGRFDPGAFQYGGAGPVSQIDYKGQQPGAFQYGGQQPGAFQYGGAGPQQGSIKSFMENDPGYDFEMQEGQKAIDRASAAGGRFGGGATAKALLKHSQGLASTRYGDRFQRAGQEREAARMGEQEGYGRDLTGYGLDVAREQQGYGRDLTGYGLGVEREMEGRRRGEYGTELARTGEQEGYGRDLTGYGLEDRRLGQQYDRYVDLAGMGQQAATATGGMYSGLGSQMLGQQFQEQQNEADRLNQKYLADTQADSDLFGNIGGLAGMALGAFLP